MCTLTAIPFSSGGFRLVFNRDEQRTRLAGLPPVERQCGDRVFLMPFDPASGGTWIAANDAGLAAALLNLNDSDGGNSLPAAFSQEERKSRGTIIPMLMDGDSVESGLRTAKHLAPGDFLPFRLILLDGNHVAVVRSDGATLAIDLTPNHQSALMWTSSGLGDQLVEKPRRELFEKYLGGMGDVVRRQDEFHRHRWPDRPHLSIRMSRDGAATVSRTIVEVSDDTVTMRHQFIPEAAEATALTLRRSTARTAP